MEHDSVQDVSSDEEYIRELEEEAQKYFTQVKCEYPDDTDNLNGSPYSQQLDNLGECTYSQQFEDQRECAEPCNFEDLNTYSNLQSSIDPNEPVNPQLHKDANRRTEPQFFETPNKCNNIQKIKEQNENSDTQSLEYSNESIDFLNLGNSDSQHSGDQSLGTVLAEWNESTDSFEERNESFDSENSEDLNESTDSRDSEDKKTSDSDSQVSEDYKANDSDSQSSEDQKARDSDSQLCVDQIESDSDSQRSEGRNESSYSERFENQYKTSDTQQSEDQIGSTDSQNSEDEDDSIDLPTKSTDSQQLPDYINFEEFQKKRIALQSYRDSNVSKGAVVSGRVDEIDVSAAKNFQSTASASKGTNASTLPRTCSICLEPLKNKCFTDVCFHYFCFECLKEWSNVKAECPLCKQKFTNILYNVKGLESYDQYIVPGAAIDRPLAMENFRRFRYRTTLTPEQMRERRARERLTSDIQMHRSIYAPHSVNFMGTNIAHFAPNRAPISNTRRRIYDFDLWAKIPVGDGRIRCATPRFYRSNAGCTHRLIPWLTRELSALLFSRGTRLMFVLDLILALIMRFDIRTPEFYSHMLPYLGVRTGHFVHEFYCFASSPYDMNEYDMHVEYGQDESNGDVVVLLSPDSNTVRPSASDVPVASLPCSSSSSSLLSATSELVKKRKQLHTEQEEQVQNPNLTQSQERQSWNGPHFSSPLRSYFPDIMFEVRNFLPSTSLRTDTVIISPVPTPASSPSPPIDVSSNDENNDCDILYESVVTSPQIPIAINEEEATGAPEGSSDNECLFVDYVKPRHERTPDIIVLNTDSEGENEEIDVETEALSAVSEVNGSSDNVLILNLDRSDDNICVLDLDISNDNVCGSDSGKPDDSVLDSGKSHDNMRVLGLGKSDVVVVDPSPSTSAARNYNNRWSNCIVSSSSVSNPSFSMPKIRMNGHDRGLTSSPDVENGDKLSISSPGSEQSISITSSNVSNALSKRTAAAAELQLQDSFCDSTSVTSTAFNTKVLPFSVEDSVVPRKRLKSVVMAVGVSHNHERTSSRYHHSRSKKHKSKHKRNDKHKHHPKSRSRSRDE